MKTKQVLVRLIFSLLTLILYNSCKEEVITHDIFEIEEANPENMHILEIDNLGKVYVNNDRVSVLDDHAQIKGTIFSLVDDEFVPITSGDFSLTRSSTDVYDELYGYGLATLPEIGVFSDILKEYSSGANFMMKSGAEIREQDPLAPLNSNQNYLGIQLDESIGEQLRFTIGNTSFQPKSLYMEPNDPMIYFKGDIGTSPFQIMDASLGLSARGELLFTPFSYSNELSSVMKTPLQSINGNIYVGGLVPIPKYHIEVFGEALIGFTANENGFNAFFENGFEGSSYRMGVNGAVTLTQDFISFLPRMEVGRATVIVELEEEGNNYIQVAGEVQIQNGFLGELLTNVGGGTLMSQFSMPEQTIESYFYVGDNPNNSQFFIRSSLSMTIPGIGEQDLINALFGVDSEHVYIGADMRIPGLAEVYVNGDVYYDGQFYISGGTSLELDVEVAKVSVSFDVLITHNGFEITAQASGEITGIGFTVEVGIIMNWETGDMELCMDLPSPVGNTCIGLRRGKQRTLNGELYHGWSKEDELKL